MCREPFVLAEWCYKSQNGRACGHTRAHIQTEGDTRSLHPFDAVAVHHAQDHDDLERSYDAFDTFHAAGK